MQTFTGLEYLKIDIAGSFGLDKESWDDRISWFNANEHQLDSLVSQAEEPAMFYAGVKAYRDVLANKPIGYMISLDATSSGLQILAALTGDRRAAELCNVVDAGYRADAYTGIYQDMLQRAGRQGNICRDDTKQAIMTAFYGSTAMPKQIFGEGPMLQVFFDSMEANAPGPWEVNQALLEIWDPNWTSTDWILPDNFHAKIKVMDDVTETATIFDEAVEVHFKRQQPVKNGRSLCANMIHSIDGMIVREMTRRCSYDPVKVTQIWQMLDKMGNTARLETEDDRIVFELMDHFRVTGFLSARILDHLTIENIAMVDRQELERLLVSLPKKPFTVISVHDCFRCLPHYGNDLRKQYNLQLQLIAKSEILSCLLSQVTGRQIQAGKIDPTLPRDIGATNYALS